MRNGTKYSPAYAKHTGFGTARLGPFDYLYVSSIAPRLVYR